MKLILSKVLIGTDFEQFIVNETGKIVSAIPLIEGTKSAPQPVSDNGHMIQHDGILFEANTPPVSIEARDEMWDNIQLVLEAGRERLPENLSLKCCATGTLEDSELEDPEARIAGCEPSFSAWHDGDVEPKPDFQHTNDRCAAFHLHISYPGCDVDNGMRLLRILDVNLALPLLFVDDDRSRRKLYGLAGSFRFKDYGNVGGVEYRTLSNIVIKSREIFDFMWAGLQKSLKQFNKDEDYLEYGDSIQHAINKYDLEEAESLCEQLEVDRLLEVA